MLFNSSVGDSVSGLSKVESVYQSGLIRVESVPGLIRVETVLELIRVESVLGLIRVESVPRLIRVETVSGLIRVETVCWHSLEWRQCVGTH